MKNESDVNAPPSTPEAKPEGTREGLFARIPLAIAGGVLAIIAFGGFLVFRSESKVNKVALSDSAKPVTLVLAKGTTYRSERLYIGTLEPWIEAKVGPQFVTAYVDTVLVRPGASVKRNDVLATLDCRNASATNQAVSMQARAIEAQQKAMADEAARLRGLLDGGFVSPNEAEQKTAMSMAEEAHLLSQKANMMNTALTVSDCILRAPFDGEVATRVLDPGAFARPGTTIVSVVDRSIVRVTGDAPEIDFGVVAPGTKVHIRMLATGKEIEGTIARRSPSADPGTRTIHFEIDVPDRERLLPVGTTSEIRIDVGAPIPVTEVPLYAAQIRGDKASVFVVAGGIAHAQTVPVEGESGGAVFLSTDLKPGSRVVTDGRALLHDGDRVTENQGPAAGLPKRGAP